MIEITREAYDQLMTWANIGSHQRKEEQLFFQIRKQCDLDNDIKRYSLAIRWKPLRERPRMDNGITPAVIITIGEFTRPPVREDVERLLKDEDYNINQVNVSADPNGILGFYELDKFPW